MSLILIIAILVPVVGFVVRPLETTVYLILPYFGVAFFGRPELGDGRPWRRFSENFPYILAMRAHLGLSFAPQPLPKELVEADERPDSKFVLACFPHGATSEFRFLMEGMLSTVFPKSYLNFRTLAASVLFHIPVVREFCLWTGCVNAARTVAERALDNGRSIVVLPGGEREQLATVEGRESVYLEKRKGFVKLALRKGALLVPMYVFGTVDHHHVSRRFFALRQWLMINTGVCIMFQTGMWWSNCPFPVKTTMVVGPPIDFQIKTEGKPTDEEVVEAHQLFCAALVTLFNKHKGPLGYGDRTLVIT